MQSVVEIVLPAFGLVLLGFALGRPPLFTADASKALGTFIFTLALPALLFRSMARHGLPGAGDLAIIGAYYSALLALAAGSFLAARLLYREGTAGSATLALGSSFSNIVLVGVPLVMPAFGPAGLHQLLLIVTFHSLVLVGLATVLVEASQAHGAGLATVAGRTVLALLRNPVLAAILCGLAVGASGVPMPRPLDRMLEMLAAAAVPCSLFALGASLVGLRVGDALGRTAFMAAAKLLVLPALVFLSARYLFDLPPLQLGVAVTCASLPMGVNVFVFSQRYGLHAQPVAGAILATTGLSALTTGTAIAVFRTVG